MARLISGSFLILAVLVNSNAAQLLANPFSILEMADTLTTRFQNMLFWGNKALGDPDATAEETLRRVKGISSKMDELHVFFNQKSDSSVMKINEANTNYDDFSTARKIIDSANIIIDTEFKKYFRFLNSTMNDGTVKAYLNQNKNQIENLEGAIFTLFNVVKPVRSDSKQLEDIVKYLNFGPKKRCNQDKSSQQWLFYLFNNIILSEVRAYTVMVFERSLNIHHAVENQKQFFIDQLRHTRNDFESRTQEYVTRFSKALNAVSRDIRRCDLEIPERNKNYFELERLYQTFLMNSDQVSFPCPACKDIKRYPGRLLKSPNENPEFKYEIHQSCEGQISDCKRISPVFGTLNVCLRKENERRRYDWFTDGTDIYGTNRHNEGGVNDCDGGSIKDLVSNQHVKRQSIQFALNEVKLCNYCMCTCAQTNATTSNAIRAISMLDQMSNVELNRVVVGVKLVLKDNIVHIQIKEGELLKGGIIEDIPENDGWVPLDTINTRENYRIKNGETERIKIREDHDYAYIDKYNNTMILEDYMAGDNMVIVGVGLSTMYNHRHKWIAIAIRIKSAPFDWATGKISNGTWSNFSPSRIDMQNINSERFGKVETNLDDPFKSVDNLPVVEHGIVRFTKSDLIKDAGQSVYPYFDAQEVVTKPSFPLGGIGLFKRGAKGFGGFIAPRIYTAKITPQNLAYTVTSIVRESTYGTN